jgi:hypothetical protein
MTAAVVHVYRALLQRCLEPSPSLFSRMPANAIFGGFNLQWCGWGASWARPGVLARSSVCGAQTRAKGALHTRTEPGNHSDPSLKYERRPGLLCGIVQPHGWCTLLL